MSQSPEFIVQLWYGNKLEVNVGKLWTVDRSKFVTTLEEAKEVAKEKWLKYGYVKKRRQIVIKQDDKVVFWHQER